MASQHQLCTFYLDGYLLGIEVEKVLEVLRHQQVTNVPLAPFVVGGVINLRGQIVTAIDLRRRLSLPDRAADQFPMNVVIQCAEGTVSLMVDEIGDVLDVDDGLFEPPPENIRSKGSELITGVYKLEDRLLLLLDVENAVSVAA